MKKLKVLMLGWEFPPIVSGGLGTACYGISKSLADKVDLTLILPKSDPDFILQNVNLTGLNNIDIQNIKAEFTKPDYSAFGDVMYVPSTITPYQTEEDLPAEVSYPAQSADAETEEAVAPAARLAYHPVTLSEPVEELNVFGQTNLENMDANSAVIQYARYATRLASQKEFDLIYAHDWMTFLAGVELKLVSGKPLVVHVHSLSYDRAGKDSQGWIYELEKQALEKADFIIPVSEYTSQIIQNEYGIAADRIQAVYNGIEPKQQKRKEKAPEEDKIVLFLGRVTEQKGASYFLDIASKVLEKNKDVQFVMAGTGNQLQDLISSDQYLQLDNKFEFTGFLDREKVENLLAIADVYCMPSVSDPFGLSAIEAAQFGVPAVISNQSGVGEVLHSALKADYNDTDAMAAHIISLLEDDELRSKVIADSYKDIEQLTWEKSTEEILQIFEKVVE
ncbi:glycosyltransferase family 1 protein [Adhaeribacter arboris]|uniref:Glycosyltransferase family 1 protein n=1 Tax=Adhaeribacter arboris TaxID=2072846 RepID=A0A2T2YG50_9BACT|nr:glycosyltransferase [Adhaeribacter arboris]PSR54491.1 glycosyltransferase family 1 protein [Adhaeribacter arboris]